MMILSLFLNGRGPAVQNPYRSPNRAIRRKVRQAMGGAGRDAFLHGSGSEPSLKKFSQKIGSLGELDGSIGCSTSLLVRSLRAQKNLGLQSD